MADKININTNAAKALYFYTLKIFSLLLILGAKYVAFDALMT